jgi:hypothetical protein
MKTAFCGSGGVVGQHQCSEMNTVGLEQSGRQQSVAVLGLMGLVLTIGLHCHI